MVSNKMRICKGHWVVDELVQHKTQHYTYEDIDLDDRVRMLVICIND